MKILRKREVNKDDEERRQVAEIFFRRVPDDQQVCCDHILTDSSLNCQIVSRYSCFCARKWWSW